MIQRIAFFIALLIAVPSHASAPSRKEQKAMQAECLKDIQKFLADQGYKARNVTGALTTQARLAEAERKKLQEACVREVRSLLKQPSTLPNPVLSEREMVQELRRAGYSLRNGNIINMNGEVVTSIKPFLSFKAWYLEWLQAKKSSRKTGTQPNESHFKFKESDFPTLSH